jgi:hypothetical protein
MTARLAERVREWMGWCPCAMQHPLREDPGRRPEDPATGRDSRPALPGANQMPDGFTALAVMILFATPVVGGNIWWPPVVLGITAAGILVLLGKFCSSEGAEPQ